MSDRFGRLQEVDVTGHSQGKNRLSAKADYTGYSLTPPAELPAWLTKVRNNCSTRTEKT
ncbi:MAG: hypothetical protein AB8B97_05385 [Granulosicoccus sp.]